jgi:hypothetical protein
LNSIEEKVLRAIGENLDSPDVFTDDSIGMAQIRTSISDALQELCMLLGCYTRDYHLPLLAQRQWYRLEPEADYIAYIIEAYSLPRRRKLEQTDVQTMSVNPWFLRENGFPVKYMFTGHNVLGVWPTPPNEGEMLMLKCVCMPKPYENDYDVIYVRDYLQRATAFYAQSEYYASRGDGKRAQQEHAQYLQIAQLTQLNERTFDRQFTHTTVKNVSGQPN